MKKCAPLPWQNGRELKVTLNEMGCSQCLLPHPRICLRLTKPHMIIPDNKAINIVRRSTGQPDNTELNTALAEVPGGSLTTMKATPGEPTSGRNL